LVFDGLLIDWLTLRYPLGPELGEALTERIKGCLGMLVCVDSDGVEQWRKSKLDIDKLRSDTRGLMWQDSRPHLFGQNFYGDKCSLAG